MEYRTGFTLWRGLQFSDWELSGLSADEEGIHRLPGSKEEPGEGPGELSGEATSPVYEAPFPFSEAVPSWNAATPGASWIDVQLRVRVCGEWSGWYGHGEWASSPASSHRRSLEGQKDGSGEVKTDKLVLAAAADAAQLRLRFHGVVTAFPSLRAAALTFSERPPAEVQHRPGNPRLWGRVIESVPRSSQMVYPDGGRVWCSPTCVSMVLGYWNGEDGEHERRVRAAVEGVYDPVYDGHGNWSFNAAYAGSLGFEAFVIRFGGLDELEPLIASGIPVVLSLSWNEEEGRVLTGAPVSKSRGHLTLIVGFDESGDPVMNEPASPSNETVRRVYRRDELETRWIESSGGTAYVIYPRARSPWPRDSSPWPRDRAIPPLARP